MINHVPTTPHTAFAELWQDVGFERLTVVWESSETFSYYNYASLVDEMEARGVEVHSAEMLRLPDNTYGKMKQALLSVVSHSTDPHAHGSSTLTPSHGPKILTRGARP